MQDQVFEAEVDVGHDLLDHLVGLVGDDEAVVRLVGVFVGDPFHLDRIVDPRFLLVGQPQRRPQLAGLEGDLDVAVVGDLDLDHLADLVRVPLGFLRALGEVRDQFAVEVRVFAAGRDEAVAAPPRQFGRQRARGGDVDRHRLVRFVVDRRPHRFVVLALEVDPLLAPQLLDQFDRLGEAPAPLFRARELAAGGGRLVQRLAGADAEEDAARGQRAERAEGLGDDRRVVAQGRGEDAGPDHHPLGRGGERAEPDQRVRRVAALVAPGLEVVGDRDDVEPRLLRLDREVEQLARPELLGRSLVTDPYRHRFLS